MQAAHRDQVNLAAKQLAQLVGKLLDLPAQSAPRLQRIENVDVAVRPRRAPGAGAEDPQLGYPIPVGDGSKALLVNLDTIDSPHDHRVTPRPQPLSDLAAIARTCEDACRGVMADRVQSLLNKRADFFNERDSAGPLAFRSLIDEPAWGLVWFATGLSKSRRPGQCRRTGCRILRRSGLRCKWRK